MKLNRRSFIQKTLTTLAALAAGLRGGTVAAVIDEDVPFLVGNPSPVRPLGILPSGLRIGADGTLYAGGEFTSMPNGGAIEYVAFFKGYTWRMCDEWGISSSTVAERIRELGEEQS